MAPDRSVPPASITHQIQSTMIEDDEVGLPQKGLNNIIKDVIPEMRIANESRELLNQCCVEFVKHISKEAQRISSGDQRKTIYHDHVQKALRNLGFPPDYVEAANSVLGECKIAAEKRLKRKNSRLDKCGIPEEQLYLMQQQLIEKARQEEAEKQQAQQFIDHGAMMAMGGGGVPQFYPPATAANMAQFLGGGMPMSSHTSGLIMSNDMNAPENEEEDYDN